MRALILSFYYRPDLSAGSFRTTAFVEALESLMGPEDWIEVLTTLPNRYQSYSQEAPEVEMGGRLRVRRIQLPLHQSGMIDQARAFTRFAYQVLRAIRGERFDVVYATSSRLFTASLGALCARRTGARLYLDIRDIFVDTIKDVLNVHAVRVLMPILRRVERYTIGSAERINLVSEGFREYFHAHYPKGRYTFFTNGIDEEFISANFDAPRHTEHTRPKILYAGNLGEGQGLHRILPSLASRLPEYEFQVVGDGGRKSALIRGLEAAGIGNVQLLLPVPREQLLALYRNADCLFLHLNDYEAFRKVLPSKIFEYAATGKPILAGLAGYSAEFLTRYVENAAVFPPCDAEAAVRALRTLRLAPVERTTFIKRFNRTRIMSAMASDVMALAVQAAKR